MMKLEEGQEGLMRMGDRNVEHVGHIYTRSLMKARRRLTLNVLALPRG